MLHKASVLISTPSGLWAQKMQRESDKIENAAKVFPPEPSELDDVIKSRLTCSPGDIVIKSNGTIVDDGKLTYEFAAYNRDRNLLVIAVLVGNGDGEAEKRFEALFPDMKKSEASLDDRAFLIVNPTGDFTRGWALRPSGKDRHTECGALIKPDYLKWLLKAAR